MNKRPVLGLDFVGTISDYPEFFEILTRFWQGTVVIISYCDTVEEIVPYLDRFNIRYDKIIAVSMDISKAKIIEEENVDFFFDDGVSNHEDLPENVASFLVRGIGNFDYSRKMWKMDRRWREITNNDPPIGE